MTRIGMLRAIVAEKQAQRIRIDGRKVLVDLYAASMLVRIYDALGEAQRESFVSLPFPRMVSIGWRLIDVAKRGG
jgi:hypothetical protein